MKRILFIQLFVVVLLFIGTGILSCNKYEKTILKEQYLPDEIPDYSSLTGFTTTPQMNAEIHLGRVLFYDKSLSKNNSVSCASCHKQEFAFADNKAGSVGFENRVTPRNSIAIQNIPPAFFGGIEVSGLFWDGRESNLQDLISKPIANHIEMGMENKDELLRKINEKPYIKRLANAAYGTNSIDMTQLSNAMSTFLFQINTRGSRFDLHFLNGTGTTLSAKELKGQELFNTTYQCSKCHNPGIGFYFGAGFANIGLDGEDGDLGRMGISGKSEDRGLFKIPDLHNVAITAPYMHDGRFKTLDEVLNHYSHGILKSSTLDSRLQDEHNEPLRLNITEEDKKLIIAFLESMTDYKMITNPLLSNPFKTK